MALTDQMRVFAHHAAQGMSGTDAALAAGYAPSNASQRAVVLSKNNAVRQLINEKLAERAARKAITQDRVAVGLAEIAFSDISDLAGIESLAELRTLPPAVRRCVKSIKVRTRNVYNTNGEGGVRTEIQEVTWMMHDKLAAFASLTKLLGLNEEQAALPPEGPTTLVQVLVNMLGQQGVSVAMAETVLPGEE